MPPMPSKVHKLAAYSAGLTPRKSAVQLERRGLDTQTFSDAVGPGANYVPSYLCCWPLHRPHPEGAWHPQMRERGPCVARHSRAGGGGVKRKV